MEIISVTLHDLRKMNNSEALILQGCGGDLKEWVDGINDMLVLSISLDTFYSNKNYAVRKI